MVKSLFLGILIFPYEIDILKMSQKYKVSYSFSMSNPRFGKTYFFERDKKIVFFFYSKIFSRGRMALKTCGKDA